ncbi:MAG: acyl-[acyl-carrier-protein]--UDP-N-acetylglucosamine O-acyltransferase [Elusimicrobia bacterium RIFCSPLOWO2_01_FULL_54_10]|nr:MAG: acyl-[acyl-carrier-protein]--UDP-N-acetylglucosamine O-acyltransferase [Elusimicrobia bacterium RIFCSPLOWO2_01_FULL_54_10]
MIHSTSIVHPTARIHESAQVGPFAIIGPDCKIGANTQIGSHCVIEFADIGASCKIFSQAFIGTAPQDLKYRGEKTRIVIGDGTIVRECATLNRGTAAKGETRIGKGCLFMAYSHVAHDCVIEDEVILANSVAVAGHVSIGMGTVVGGLSGIHQFVKIGKMAMVGAGSMVPMDVPPYCTVSGDRARIVGLNAEGMKRRHVSKESIESLKRVYKKIFFSKGTLKQITRQVRSEKHTSPEVRDFLQFISSSGRGVCRPRLKAETSASQTW